MITFQVSDMTCGRCATAISRAIADVDRDAHVEVRIPQKLVVVGSTASAAELARAIQDAGYTAREVRDEAQASAAEQARGCGCGCGSPKIRPVDAGQEPVSTRGSCCAK